ncbi:nuclear transport factor 2 family protein [Caenimonas sedimenti]|uniref:Nuclear transport factor 2 family protein n=1 Tax=Caenimonas sedimenti TaxID=2596921 RepID=A0A562ZNJ9_9BURK|nr:nuclear transport factor 2 family protein [Caenimonas sedimenti]TWO69987.1 nuclear transport factor 2 family protein [Caenimonas sedimenti]
MSSTELDTNRHTALEFFRRFDADDIPGVLDLMADDIAYWLGGKPGTNATAGRVHTKQEMADIFRRMTRALKDGRLRMTVKNTTAEGDRVAVEAESYGELLNGRVYNQEYHVVMTIRNGKIAAAREYMDTAHVNAVWYQA